MEYEKIKDQEYDIYYFSKMWKVVVSYNQYQNYKKTNAFEPYKRAGVILESFNSISDIEINATLYESKYESVNKKSKLTKEIWRDIKNYLTEDAYDLVLKPYYHLYNEKHFLKAYALLQDSCNKEIIESLIISNTDSFTINQLYCAKNIQLTLDAFGIAQSEVDKKINIQSNDEKAQTSPVAKLLYKETRDVNFSTLEAIAKAVNEILENKRRNDDSCTILKKDYFDTVFSDIQYCYKNNVDSQMPKPTYEFYKSENHPITLQDLERGRMVYVGTDKDILDKYSKYENDFLAQRYKAMKPLERKMIFDFIYELVYCEYKKLLLKEEISFLEQLGVSNEKIKSFNFSKQPETPRELYVHYIASTIKTQ